ncbi:MAG: oligosaccharide flippase family protein [Pseudomonadales bacterium]|nr:oligosaccharide flippase family protein [Pseudomonadales bacterium]
MQPDLSGKSQFSYNVIVYWLAQIFVAATGFIVPRQISDNLGTATLGVWDLGWATYNYLALTGIGALGVNRYIALHRGNGDLQSQLKIYASAIVLQILVSLGLVVVTVVLTLLAKNFDGEGFDPDQVQVIVLVFCISLIIRLLGDPSRGVLTGAHRWDLHHIINASQDVLLGAALIIALKMGADLITLSILVLISSILVTTIRIMVKNSICPEIKFTIALWDKTVAKQQLKFGLKTLTNTSSQLILFQTTAIILGLATGPAALAIYTRSQTLVRICAGMMQKIANMFVPISSGLVGLDREQEANDLIMDTCTMFMCIAIPISLGMFFFGDLVVYLWMGEQYANRELVTILAVGSLLPIANTGAFSVLAGLNAHGRLGVASLSITVLGLIILVPITQSLFGINFISTAYIVAIIWTISRGLSIPVLLQLRFGIPLSTYAITVIIIPAFFFIPMASFFYMARISLVSEAYLTGFCIIACASIATLGLIWAFLLPQSTKDLLLPGKAN